MIDRPGVRLVVRPAARWEVRGLHPQRTRQVVRRCLERLGDPPPPACCVEVLAAAPQHVGLGTGTQLALAVCVGLLRLAGHPLPTSAQLATLSGRARRSAIGTYGFSRGGLLYEEPKRPEDRLAPLQTRLELPSSWRWLLVRPAAEHGLHGTGESRAFAELPDVPQETVQRLRREVEERMLPAAAARDLAALGQSIYEYGVTAGRCFAARQSAGPFATPRLARLVTRLRDLGARGVGQSSWGPTIFALCGSQAEAEEYLQRLTADEANADLSTTIAAPNNTGAAIEVLP